MPERRHRDYNIEELCKLKDDGNHWLVKNMIPRIGRTMAWGDGGSYKTSMLFDLAVAVASGGYLLRQYPIEVHGPVYIVSAEGSKYTNRDRILAHLRGRELFSEELRDRKGVAPLPTVEQVPLHYCQQAYDLGDLSDQREFEESIDRIRPVYVMLDPLDSFIDGDENSANDTKRFRRFLDYMIEKYEFALTIVHHATKDKDNPTIRGSSAWRGWIDSSLHFIKKTHPIGNITAPCFELISQKQRDGEEGSIFTAIPEFDKARNITTYSTVVESSTDNLLRAQTQLQVLGVIENYQGLLQKEIMEFTGLSYKRVSNAINALYHDGYIAQDVYVKRPTSGDGSRTRKIQAWRSLEKISAVDATAAMLLAQTQSPEDSNAPSESEVLSTELKASHGNYAEYDSVCSNAVSPGSPISHLC